MAERIELHVFFALPNRRSVRAWAFDSPASWQYRKVIYGTYGEYGWWVERIGQRWGGVWLVPDERAACDLITRWLGRGEGWRPSPATYDEQERPADAGSWYQSGNTWYLGEPPAGHRGRVVRNPPPR